MVLPFWNFVPNSHIHTHTRLTALFPGLPGWAGTKKVKPIWILLKQETVSGSGISWAMYKSAPRSRQVTMYRTPPLSFYRLDALPAAQPTVSEHWRQTRNSWQKILFLCVDRWNISLAWQSGRSQRDKLHCHQSNKLIIGVPPSSDARPLCHW